VRERIAVPLIVGVIGVLAALGFNWMGGHRSAVHLDSSQRPPTTIGGDAPAAAETPGETTTSSFDIFSVTPVAEPSSGSRTTQNSRDRTTTSREKSPERTTSSHDPNKGTAPTTTYGTTIDCNRDPSNPYCDPGTEPPTTRRHPPSTDTTDTTDKPDPHPF
jgi:hypothetical protein